MHIFLDIETIPAQGAGVREEIAAGIAPPGNYKKAETIAEWEREQKPALVEEAWRRTALDGALGQIACAALAIGDAPPVAFYAEDWARAEPGILRHLFAAIRAAHDAARHSANLARPVLVGHNIAGFDLRFLFQRAVLHGIEPPAVIPFQARPWDDCIFDTMSAWAGHGNRVALDKLCRALSVPGKGSEIGEEIDGSKVWDFVADGRIAEVAEYCKGDVERVRAVFRRLTFAVKPAAAVPQGLTFAEAAC
jgi:hypothetical protein